MHPKNVLASKTLWANLALVVGALGSYFTGESGLGTTLAVILPAMLNFGLRFLTHQPLDV